MRRLTFTILLLAGGSPPLASQAARSGEVIVLTGATVVDPSQPAPIPRASVVVREGKIQSITQGPVAVPGARVIDLAGWYLTPGLIDAHVHIGDFASARRALLSGVTTARSMGVAHFVDVGLRGLQQRGAIEAPEIVAAGYHVRPQPADQLFLDAPTLSDLRPGGLRGPDALRRVVQFMILRGVDVIKVNATERAGLPETDPRTPYYSEDELRVLVETARAGGLPVAAHAHGDGGARAAVRAGVRSIEHGTYLSDETLDLMRERGTFLVPTIAVVADLTLPGGDYDNPALQIRGRHMLPRVREMAGRAFQKGVKIATGSDTGYGAESVVRLSHELIELVGVGLTPRDAVRAATSQAAELLGVAHRTGSLAPGMEADLLVLERNPLDDIGAFQDPLLVMSDGRIVLDRTAR